MLMLLKNYTSLHLPPHPLRLLSLVPFPHFLTLVFSSSPFFRLPQSQEFAAGQKAAAEAQPIWNAAPPSWRSEREKGTRLVVNQADKATSCLYAQPTGSASLDLLDCSLKHAPYSCLVVSVEICMKGVKWACQFYVKYQFPSFSHRLFGEYHSAGELFFCGLMLPSINRDCGV